MNDPKAEIICFTDPYCSWCWATEPVLYRLRETYRDQICLRFVMGGLVRDMSEFFDGANNIRATSEVMPHWRMVSERTGQPINERLMGDITDPHWSTWPACIAVKAVDRQSPEIGNAYLRRLRRAALTERKLISDAEIYTDLAGDVAGLDMDGFLNRLSDGTAEQAFREDLKECRRFGASGFPSILIQAGDRGIMVNGYRPYKTYADALHDIADGLTEYPPRSVAEILGEYGPMTTRELSEVLGLSMEETRTELEILSSNGKIRENRVRGGEFWLL
jgi:predicted DsbA family dithiol-disulfide isomerase